MIAGGLSKMACLAGALALTWVVPCYGALNFDLNYSFSGNPPASSTQPWANVIFQNDGNGGVFLQVTTPNLTFGSQAYENLSGVYLNFNPNLNISRLTFNLLAPTDGSIAVQSIQAAQNSFKADGDGFYDILLSFPTGQGLSSFGPNERLLYDIHYNGGAISYSDFDFVSEHGGGNGQYYAAAHVQNTLNGAGSGWIGAQNGTIIRDVVAIPEVGTRGAALAALLVSLAAVARRFRPRLTGL